MVIKELCLILENLFPMDLAWDNDLPRIGFVLGDKNQQLKNILLTLDINLEVIEEAISKDVNFIVTHHPIIFHPIYKIDYDTPLGKIIEKLVKNNICVYSMHTNLDVGLNGVADKLSSKLGLKNVIGENKKDSYMRIGEVYPTSFNNYLNIISENLNLSGLKYAGDLNKIISKVAILGGSGGNDSYVLEALSNNVDLYISSEFKLSSVQLAISNNMCVVEINHGVEKLVFTSLKDTLLNYVHSNIYISEVETDPFSYYTKKQVNSKVN